MRGEPQRRLRLLSGLGESLGVALLVLPEQAGLCAAKVPARGDTGRAVEAAPGQGCFDPAADFGLGLRFGSEEHP